MKQWTIAQRLKATLTLIVFLLLAGVTAIWWMQKGVQDTEQAAQHQRETLLINSAHIRLSMSEMNDAMRGVLLDPKNLAEKKRKTDADAEVQKIIEETKPLVKNYPALSKAIEGLDLFDENTLNKLEDTLFQLLTTNTVAATDFYNQTYMPTRSEEGALLADFDREVERVAEEQLGTTAIVAVYMGVLVLLITSITAYLGWGLVRAITGPLGHLLTAIERLQAGDFTHRVALERRDEFGILGEGLNQTAINLAQLVGRVQQSGVQVNTGATEMAATLKEQQATANEVASTSVEIGATAKEISATAKELGRTVGEVATGAEQTAHLAGGGQAGLSKLELTMQQVMAATTTISAKLAILNEKTANINSVVTTINKVADQTNLLSLNAAIEAEKAGQYGQGFAVVATEIRRLADQTAVATYDIEQMVKEMQSAVAAGVMGMDKFNEEVRRGADEAKTVTAQLGQIIQQVQALTPRFETVNEGMQSQSTAAMQISDALGQLGETTQQSAQAFRQNTEAIEQLTSASHGLQDAVSRFKVK